VIPFLYLYRRELPTSGGHGRWRGGTTLVTAWTGWGSDESFIASGGLMQSATLGNGLSGAFPSSAGVFWSAEHSAIADALAAGTWPANREQLRELAPDGGLPPAKKFDNPLRDGDLFEVVPPLAAGHGDPVLRSVDLVALDVARGRLSVADADRLYGVVLGDDGAAHPEATERRREAVRRERLASLTSAPPLRRGTADGPVRCSALETVSVRDVHGAPCLCCASCGEVLGTVAEGYREGCGRLETPLQEIDPALFLDPLTQLDETLVVRHYVCPGCAAFLDADVCRPGEALYADVELVVDALPHRDQ
jgi:N-methylhydantoinase B